MFHEKCRTVLARREDRPGSAALRLCPVTPLVLIMMTDLPSRELKQRRADLESMTPGVVWAWGPERRARDDKWSWQMGCAQVSAP
jgi:hypothetical protein